MRSACMLPCRLPSEGLSHSLACLDIPETGFLDINRVVYTRHSSICSARQFCVPEPSAETKYTFAVLFVPLRKSVVKAFSGRHVGRSCRVGGRANDDENNSMQGPAVQAFPGLHDAVCCRRVNEEDVGIAVRGDLDSPCHFPAM